MNGGKLGTTSPLRGGYFLGRKEAKLIESLSSSGSESDTKHPLRGQRSFRLSFFGNYLSNGRVV